MFDYSNIIDEIILKIYDNDKEEILYMLSFQKTIMEGDE